jgi:hypothetical protein
MRIFGMSIACCLVVLAVAGSLPKTGAADGVGIGSGAADPSPIATTIAPSPPIAPPATPTKLSPAVPKLAQPPATETVR